MSDKDQVILQELLIELPPGASRDQSGVKAGYYRTSNGRQKKISSQRTSLTVRRHTVDLMNFAPVGGNTRLVPLGEDVIIQMDRYMDEATCKACRGAGHGESVCTDCGGSKVWWVDENGGRDKRASSDKSLLKSVPCATCRASQAGDPIPRSTGYLPCRPCAGTGQAGVGQTGIAQSTADAQEPTTGVILAIGKTVTLLERGQRVMFSKYAGDEYIYDRRTYRIMNQRYARCMVIGNDDVRIREAAGGVRA